MSAATATGPVYDGEAARLVQAATPLTEPDVRYLRKAIRHRISRRQTPATTQRQMLDRERADELERLADWIVQADA